MKKLSVIFAIILLFCLCGCQSAGSSDTSSPQEGNWDRERYESYFLAESDGVQIEENFVTFTDANGAEQKIAKGMQKVYNLYASFTTLWYEAGGQVAGCIGGDSAVEIYKEYIGRDITQDDSVTVLATNASGKRWSVETIIAGHPDLIICSTAMNGYATIAEPAQTAGIPVVAVDYDDFSDYLKWFKVFCHLTDNASLWESVALDALSQTLDVLERIPESEHPSYLSIFSGGTNLQGNLSTTVIGGMANLLGARNILEEFSIGDATKVDVNLEFVYAAQPNVILVQCHNDVADCKQMIVDAYGENPLWLALQAVQTDKVFYLPKTLFHNKPNRRFADAYRILAQILYPQVDFS